MSTVIYHSLSIFYDFKADVMNGDTLENIIFAFLIYWSKEQETIIHTYRTRNYCITSTGTKDMLFKNTLEDLDNGHVGSLQAQ